MRIVHIAPHFAEYALRLSAALAERHQVLCILDEDNSQAELIDRHQSSMPAGLDVITIRDYPLKNPLGLLNVPKVVKLVRGFRPDVLHLQEAPTDYLAGAMPFIRNLPLVLTVHDPTPHSGVDLTRWRMERYRGWLRRMSDVAIVHGESIRAGCDSLVPQLAGKTYAIRHGPLGQETASGQCGQPDWIDGRLLFFGRIEKYKGLTYLLDALDIIERGKGDVSLCIAGRGSDLDNLRDRIARYPNCIVREEYIPAGDLFTLFRSANVVVMPYTDGTQSGVAAMAMGFGRPVVATNVGSISEMVHDDVTGILVEPRDPRALATAIERVTHDRGLASRFAANARTLGETTFSWSAIGTDTEVVYEEAKRRRRDRLRSRTRRHG